MQHLAVHFISAMQLVDRFTITPHFSHNHCSFQCLPFVAAHRCSTPSPLFPLLLSSKSLPVSFFYQRFCTRPLPTPCFAYASTSTAPCCFRVCCFPVLLPARATFLVTFRFTRRSVCSAYSGTSPVTRALRPRYTYY
jgi:hypothetical protein